MPSPLPWSPRMPPLLPWSPPMPPPLPPMPPGGPPTLLLASLSHLIEDDAAFAVSCVLLLVAACALSLFCYRTLTSCKLTRPGWQNVSPMDLSKQLPMHAYEGLPMHAYESLVDIGDDDNESRGHTPRIETPFRRGFVKSCTSVFEARTPAFQARRGSSRVSGTSVPRRPPDSDAVGRRSDQTLVQSRLRRLPLGMTAFHPPLSDSERSMVLQHRRNGSSSRRGCLTFGPLPALLEEDETDSNSAMQQSSEQTAPALSRRVTLGATGLHPPPLRTDSERAMMAHGHGGSTSRAGGCASYRPLSSTREDEVNSHRSINETERLELSLTHAYGA